MTDTVPMRIGDRRVVTDDVIEVRSPFDDRRLGAVVALEEVGLLLAEEMPIIWTGSDLPLFAHTPDVLGIASWVTPDGTLGDGAAPATTFWGQVWKGTD